MVAVLMGRSYGTEHWELGSSTEIDQDLELGQEQGEMP